MSDEIYLLSKRTEIIEIGSVTETIGVLRHLCEVSEINDSRADEIIAEREALGNKVAPPAVMLPQSGRFELAGPLGGRVQAQLILGWDGWRSMVTSFRWDYLPTLGYAIFDRSSQLFKLHQEMQGQLHPISASEALEKNILNKDGELVRHGQPEIVRCISVRRDVSTSYVIAECILSDGQETAIKTYIDEGETPKENWYVGKLPAETGKYNFSK